MRQKRTKTPTKSDRKYGRVKTFKDFTERRNTENENVCFMKEFPLKTKLNELDANPFDAAFIPFGVVLLVIAIFLGLGFPQVILAKCYFSKKHELSNSKSSEFTPSIASNTHFFKCKVILNICQHNLAKTAPLGFSKCRVILSQGVPNLGFSRLKVFWFKNNIVYICLLYIIYPETVQKHVLCILITSSISSQIRVYRMGAELARCKCKSSPLYRTQGVRFEFHRILESIIL